MTKLISAEVNNYSDISFFVKKYVDSQAKNDEPPFQHSSEPAKNQKHVHKATLSDWRSLYSSQKKKSHSVREYRSDRKFSPSKTSGLFSKKNAEEVEVVIQNRHNKTSNSWRRSYLESAIVQNYYQNQFIEQRRIQTAKIRRHYQKQHSERASSINETNRRLIQSRINCTKFATERPHKAKPEPNNHQILHKIWAQKYESIRIKRKHLRKQNDIKIEGIRADDANRKIAGLIYCSQRE